MDNRNVTFASLTKLSCFDALTWLEDGPEIRKLETRNSKQFQITKFNRKKYESENKKEKFSIVLNFCNLIFGFFSDFDIRISVFIDGTDKNIIIIKRIVEHFRRKEL